MKFSSKNRDSFERSWDYYKFNLHNEGLHEVEVLKPVTTHFTTVINFETYKVTLQS